MLKKLEEIPLVNQLKIMGAKTISGNFVVNHHFEIKGLKNIFIPGTLARDLIRKKNYHICNLKNSNIVANYIKVNYLKSFS